MKCKRDIVIPSATYVPQELQNMGKLPGIIYPINQRIVFDYLYEQYKGIDGNIDIICFQGKDIVHRRLSGYNDSKVHIKDLDELNDLGHTLYFAIKEKHIPIIINFADTILMDDILKYEDDTVFYAEDFLCNTWTYFEIENGEIVSILDKEEVESEEKQKLFAGVFVIKDSKKFCECLERAFATENRGMSTFYYALCEYSRVYPMTAIKVENWFDIGHADTYYNSKLEVKAREFNHITVDKNRGILRKTSDDTNKFIGEILWYLKLPADVEYARPRIFSYSISYEEPYVSMEYYAYHTIHELFLYGDLKYHQWNDIFERIRFVCDDFSKYSVSGQKILPALEDIYLNKTIQRFDKLRKDNRFHRFFSGGIKINGKCYLSLDAIETRLKTLIPEMLYDVNEFHIIHGDLCFANIMVDNNLSFIKVIDPRGKFGEYDIYGDSRYELAKLFHSVDGKYDFIIKDLFSTEYDLENGVIQYRIQERKREFDLYKLFLHVFAERIGNDLSKIELIESLLFLSMIPLHGESLDHQIVMLATGVEILNRVCDITLNEENVNV